MDDDPLVLGLGQVVRRGNHAIVLLQTDDVHLLGAEPPGREGAVKGDPAAAQNDDLATDLPNEAEDHVAQKLHPLDGSPAWGTVSARSFQAPVAISTASKEARSSAKGISLPIRVLVLRLHPRLEDKADLHIQDVLGKPVFGYAEPRNAPQGRTGLEDRDLVSEKGCKIAKGESRGTSADNGDLFPRRSLRWGFLTRVRSA